MKHLSTTTTHVYDIELDSLTDRIMLYPFGDVHRFANNCDVDRWKWFLERAEKAPKNTYFLGMGDYDDFASYSEAKKIKGIGLHETTIDTIEEFVEKRNRMFAKEISFMRGRLIGLIGGNHTWINEQGITSDEDLAGRLGAKYLGWLSIIKLRFSFKNTTTQTNVRIMACHGLGGGRVLGAQVRKVEDMFHIFPGADLYMMGHDHSRGAWPQPRLIDSTTKDGGIILKQQRQFYCRTGSFQKSYEEGRGGYATGRLMRPADLGVLKIDIGFHRDRKDGGSRVITDIEVTI